MIKKAIFVCASGTWLDQARITLHSICQHAKNTDIFLFTNGIGFRGISDINTIKFDEDIKIVEIDSKMPGEGLKHGIKEEVICMRMVAMSYLKKAGYDVGLHLDADIVMLRPLPESFWIQQNGVVEDTPFRALNKKPYNVKKMRDIKKKNGILVHGSMKKTLYHQGSRYFNAGMMRVNLHSDKFEDIFGEYLKYRANPDAKIQFLDQDFLNWYLQDDYELLDLRYNSHIWQEGNYDSTSHTWLNKEKTLQEATNEIYSIVKQHVYFIHYAYDLKPWNKPNKNKEKHWHIMMMGFWNDVAKETKYLSDDMLERIAEVEEFIKDFPYEEIEINFDHVPIHIEVTGVQPADTLMNFFN